MADKTYTLVGDNQTSAEWTDVNDVTPDQKVLIGTIDEKFGNMKAEWRPSSQAAVFIEKTITENGVYDPQQENADGYSMVTVTTPTADLGTKTITDNGTYAATDDNKDGFSEVTVNVPNTYTSSDEGKVVTNGSLVSQTGITVTENGTIDTTLNNQVIVDVPTAPTPAPSVKSGAVFRDYDGTIVYSYTKEQVAELDNLPVGPTHDGLLFQKWNCSLSNIKSYVNKYGYVEVGATYITDDGKTRYYIFIREVDTEGTISLGLNGTAVIDWGDGSETDTITGEDIETNIDTTHTYTTVGKYTITINITDGNASLMGIQNLTLGKIEIGSNVTSIGDNAFYECYVLASITIPERVTSIGDNAFYECYALASITIPERVTSIGDNAFYGCQALTSITIPEGVTSIGDSAFYECYSLASITIPEGVTSIGESAFYGCQALTSITIPEGVTSIGGNAFYRCALTSITIPEGVTSIGGNAFSCCALTSITFESTTPPTINSDSFEFINPFCTIYVPTGTLEAYTTAENYPDPTIYTYVEY